MISAADLISFGLDPKSLQARFDKDRTLMTPVEQKLVERWKSRTQAGRDWNLLHYKSYLAVDRAWDAGWYQSTQTIIGMVKDLVETKNEEQAMNVVREWRMTHLLASDIDPKTGQPTGKQSLSLPALYSVMLSLPRAYSQMRIARIVNERRSSPFMKFESAFSSDANRLYGDVLTQRVDVMARDFGYVPTFSQAVQGAVKYGHQIQFIKEEWYSRPDYDGGPQVGKEGLRYTLPHPNRTYYDTNHPLWTLNTGTGCRYTGYWRITTFDEIRMSKQYWNIDRVSRSYRMLDSNWQIYFQTSGSCAVSPYPSVPSSAMFSQIDRENQTEQPYYTKAMGDQPVWVTEHFEMFNPRVDLDDLNMPDTDLWLRVILASDDTPLYVSVLPDRPATVWLYEPDDTRALQEGLVLQVLPFSDLASNLLTQMMVSAKQGLANATLWDGSVLHKDDVRKILNPNGAEYTRLNFVEFDGSKLLRQLEGRSLDEVFRSFRFPAMDITSHIAVLGQLLQMLERVVGMSAQEVGSYASHEQTAEEQRVIHTATSQRFEYIASWTDQAFEAWKSQIYTYLMAYGNAVTLANISSEMLPMAVQAGFELVPNADGTALVKAPLNRLRIESFISQRDGPNRVPWVQIGQQMLQVLPNLAPHPLFANDPAGFAKMLNTMFEALGFPRDFRVKSPQMATPSVEQMVDAKLQEMAAQAKQYVDSTVREAVASALPPAAPASPDAALAQALGLPTP